MLIKLEFSRHVFGKYSNIEFNENRSVEAELLDADRKMGGQTARKDEAYNRVSKFCYRT